MFYDDLSDDLHAGLFVLFWIKYFYNILERLK